MRYLEHRLALKNGLVTNPPKVKKPINKISEKKKKQLLEDKPDKELMQQWFRSRVAEMTGRCLNCGEKINRHNYTFAIMSVAHILPKRDKQFPSVKTNENNWIELCVTNGCHNLYDRSWEDAAKMKIWPSVIEKFKLIYPFISAKEKRNIPDLMMQEIEPGK